MQTTAGSPRRPKAHHYRTPGLCGFVDDALYELDIELIDVGLDEVYNQGTFVLSIATLVGTNVVNLLTVNRFPDASFGQAFEALTGPWATGFGTACAAHAVSDIICSQLRVRPSVAKYISAGAQAVAYVASAGAYLYYGIPPSQPTP